MTLKRGPWIWSFSIFLLGQAAFGLNLNYVSPKTRARLQKEFASSVVSVPSQLDGLWMCEMVGMKTGLQHEKNLPLYEFVSKGPVTFENKGAAPNSSYSLSSDHKELTSFGNKVSETLHFMSENELIARMTRSKSAEIVAFAHCRKGSRSLTQSPQSIETVATHD